MSQFHKGSRWYAVQTRSRFEKRVTTDLSSKGVESYCPAIAEVHQWADRKKIVDQPVFPGYVFAKFQDSGPLRLSILQTPGAVRILGDARTIEPIPDEEIESIQKLISSGQPCFPSPFLQEGALVRVRRGALKNLQGLLVRVKNQTRLVLSVNLLSQSVAAEVEARDVEIIRHAPELQ